MIAFQGDAESLQSEVLDVARNPQRKDYNVNDGIATLVSEIKTHFVFGRIDGVHAGVETKCRSAPLQRSLSSRRDVGVLGWQDAILCFDDDHGRPERPIKARELNTDRARSNDGH
jgi:hypothetical protein